ncbi:MAG: FhaA domain-containing protein [Raoultibacter sp.]|jgi:hypothetical protein
MGIFSRFEGRVEDTVEGAANKMFDSPISPVQIAKKAEKQMRREKMVGAGKQYAPTLYSILVNSDDDERLFGYYPTLAGETETYLRAKAADEGLVMDGQPLVRFIADEGLKRGKFEVIAELVASPIVEQLRAEEMDRYGIGNGASRPKPAAAAPMRPANPQNDWSYRDEEPIQPAPQNNYAAPQNPGAKPPLPYVPEDEIDYSIDYGEYTFDSQNFDDQQQYGDANPDLMQNPNYGQAPADYEAPHKRVSEPLGNRNVAPMPPAGMPVPGAPVPGAAVENPVQAQGGVPNTVVFASGGGNAQPAPSRETVRASLMDIDNNRTYDLATNRLLLGRDTGSDIVVDDINASRSHAELRFEPQGVWVISDLGSTNGTFVNGTEVSAQALYDGDYLTIGTTNYLFMQQQ